MYEKMTTRACSSEMKNKSKTYVSEMIKRKVLSYGFWDPFRMESMQRIIPDRKEQSLGTLPVTDKDLASTYVLCHLSPTCP